MNKEFSINGQTYYVNKVLVWIFGSIILVLGIWSITISQGKAYAYAECIDSSSPCFNQFYNSSYCRDGTLDSNSDSCMVKIISPGDHVGEQPPFIVTYFIELVIVSIILFLGVNHFIYNKGFKFMED